MQMYLSITFLKYISGSTILPFAIVFVNIINPI